MDVEVRQAQRVLQRAGIQTLSEATTLEEFPLQYGNLLLAWLRRQGLSSKVFRMQNGEAHIARATAFLRTELQADVRFRNYFQFRSGFPVTQMGAASAATLDDNQIMAACLSNLSPTDITTMFSAIAQQQSTYSGSPLGTYLFFFVEPAAGRRAGYPANDQALNVTGYTYMYTIPTQEDIAKEASGIAKQAQKKAAAAEKRRKTMEAKEKALLKKLQEKYADSDAS